MSDDDHFWERVGCGALLWFVWRYLDGEGCGCALFIVGTALAGAVVVGLGNDWW